MKGEVNSEQRVREELKSLKDKADLLASIHSRLSDEYSRAHVWISSLLLAVSTLLVGLTFISEDFVFKSTGLSPDALKWVVGVTSILNFTGVLLLAEWKFQDKAASYREAVRFYFNIVNKIRKIIDSGEKITVEIVEEIRTEYGRTNALPKIPDARFLKLKQWHLQKIAISRELNKHPFESLSSVKKKFANEDKLSSKKLE